jgi:transcriptional regulator TrmB
MVSPYETGGGDDDDNTGGSNRGNSGGRTRKRPGARRNIQLTHELMLMNVTELVIQDHNLMMRIGGSSDELGSTLILCKCDLKEITSTEKKLESQLAAHVGRRGGLPSNFDVKACSAAVTIAIWNDIDDRYKEQKKQENAIADEVASIRAANDGLSFVQWQTILNRKHQNLKDIINIKMPEIWPGLEFGLSLLRILNIEDCTLPLIGILLGRPGCGKTVSITLLSKWLNTYYTDSFSPKSWVTHTTAVDSQEDLEAIDMLPKIRNKEFLTPELATLFNVREDELQQTLKSIIRIADGNGFSSDSGAHGHRGYGDVMFTWLGAVVDIPLAVYKVLGSLGPKLYFFRLPYREISDKKILEYISGREDFNTLYQAIQSALFDYLVWFEICPSMPAARSYDLSTNPGKIAWNPARDENVALECIVQLAKLLGHLRREGAAYIPEHMIITDATENEGYQFFVGPKEDVKRTATVLKNLAKAHALNTGRNYITIDDIPIVAKTVLSTARIERVKAFIALLDNNGTVSAKELASELGISRSKAYRIMVELQAIGLVEVEESSLAEYTESGNPAMIKIMRLVKSDFGWFLTDQFKKIRDNFTPVDNRKYIGQEDPEKQVAKAATTESKPTKSNK